MSEIDLTPKEVLAPLQRTGFTSPRNWILSGVLLIVAGFILYQALGTARVFVLNLDEAVAQRDELVDERFRMQGVVLTEPDSGAAVYAFALGHGGEQAVVEHVGEEPTDLFQCGQNVIVEGVWEDEKFVSEQILVKHSEEYLEENSERIITANNQCAKEEDLNPGIVLTRGSR